MKENSDQPSGLREKGQRNGNTVHWGYNSELDRKFGQDLLMRCMLFLYIPYLS